MKILIALCAIFAVSVARVVITAEGPGNPHLLGVQECTWGPSYWCENIKTAAGCNATKHCIKTIWKEMQVPEDNDDVCDICKDMVEQARDQLQSNQTQGDLEAVFEGSCKLMHIKPIVKECISIVDQFIPELIETLASQMNPSVVCSVAGLCNSAHMDKLLEEYQHSKTEVDELKSHSLKNDELEPDECSKCYTIAAHMEHKLSNTPRDKMLQQMLSLCGELSSFSDACSATILTYFDTIYTHLHDNFNAQNICHLSGQCNSKFHKHEDGDKTLKVEIRPLSSVGMVDVSDDLPCKLCEQLVGHLRDILVANTTEAEFALVLEGLCKQTKSFASECTAIVDEYYPEIYGYLTNGLNSNIVCQMSGICPAPGKTMQNKPIWPLVPTKVAEIGVRILQASKKSLDSDKQEQLSKSEVEAMQLPIERMIPFPISEMNPLNVRGGQSCALCEYALHYVQEALTNPITEDKVKQALGKVCKKLPVSVKGECSEFVDTYGDAVVAILAQEIDPSQVCPMLHLCPSQKLMELWESVPKSYMIEDERNKPSCPLCLLALSQIYNVIKDNKTEANIEAALDKLCIHLPKTLNGECVDLVKGYSKELVELLLADLTPQEVCVYIKLCDANQHPGPKDMFITNNDGEILTNEIPDIVPQSEEIIAETDKGVTCVVCELLMKHVDKEIGKEKARDKIEKVVHGACKHLPKFISRECNKFVKKYTNTIITLITKDVSPKLVCSSIGFCTFYEVEVKASVTECAVCETMMSAIHKLLGSSKVDGKITDVVSKACKYVPSKYKNKCVELIKSYGPSIINLLNQHVTSSKVCTKIALCAPYNSLTVALEGSRMKRSYEKNRIKHCTWGPVYWCSSNETAYECKAVEHCRENVWKADFAPPKQIALSEPEPNA